MPHRREILAAVGAGTVLSTAGFAAVQAQQDEEGDGQAEDGTAAETQHYLAVLTGDQQVPPVETEAHGTASFAVDPQGIVHYALVVSNLENPTMAHIHQAPAGENGPVVQWLHPGSEPGSQPQQIAGRVDGVLQHGAFSANDFVGPLAEEAAGDGDAGDAAADEGTDGEQEGPTIEALLELLRNEEAYVNVHTEQNPDGEIRGQIHPFDAVAEALAPEQAEEPAETPTETPGDGNETGMGGDGGATGNGTPEADEFTVVGNDTSSPGDDNASMGPGS